MLQLDVQAALAASPGEAGACCFECGAVANNTCAAAGCKHASTCDVSTMCSSRVPMWLSNNCSSLPHLIALAATSDEWWDAVTDGLADSMADVILAALAATHKLFESASSAAHGATTMRTNARRTALRVCLVMGPLIDTWRMLPSHAQVWIRAHSHTCCKDACLAMEARSTCAATWGGICMFGLAQATFCSKCCSSTSTSHSRRPCWPPHLFCRSLWHR